MRLYLVLNVSEKWHWTDYSKWEPNQRSHCIDLMKTTGCYSVVRAGTFHVRVHSEPHRHFQMCPALKFSLKSENYMYVWLRLMWWRWRGVSQIWGVLLDLISVWYRITGRMKSLRPWRGSGNLDSTITLHIKIFSVSDVDAWVYFKRLFGKKN